jgi:opacity protein-like surface antigen
MLNRILLAGAFVVGTTVAAAAADLPPPPMAPAPPPPPMASPAFDWSGMYFGIYGGAITDFVTAIGQAGAQVGFNMQRGSFVAGLELQAGVIFAGGAFGYEADANAKLGFALGQRALLYGEAGVGLLGATGTMTFVWNAGGGIEFAIRDPMSIFAEAKVVGAFGGGVPVAYLFQGGLNWHR